MLAEPVTTYDTIILMSRLEELVLFILDRADKKGINDLSKFQLFKIPYLIQVLSIKYAGSAFIPEATFLRDQNGPISVDLYAAVEDLENKGYIKKEVVAGHDGYGFERHSHSLKKKLPKLSFSPAETMFLDNFLAKLLPLSQKKLKEIAYATEPMEAIQKKETGGKIKKGAVIDFSTVTVDPDIVDVYSDAA
jgi:uncharacterized phage-associated protein